MNYELFIARRIIASKQYKSSISSPIIKIGIIAIALGLIIMMISMAVGLGMQVKVREKLSGFTGHIQITSFDNNNSEETLNAIPIDQEFYPEFQNIDDIKNVQVFGKKAGIIRTETTFEGIILKGVSGDHDWSFFQEYLIEGELPSYTDEVSFDVLISKELCKRLELSLGDEFNTLFVKEDPNKAPWLRVFTIVGIFNSGFQEFDESYIIGDISHIQKMNRWSENEVGGFEVLIDDFDDINAKSQEVYRETSSVLNSQSVIENYPALFEWVSLFDINIMLIIVVMIIVASINMITVLLVLILDRTQMIGILKALGSGNSSIRKVFLYNAGYLILKGLFWGNLIGLTLLLLQYHFELISLNPADYYVNTVPVHIDISSFILLNIGTLVLCMLMLIIPTYVISKISPIKSIQFE